MTNTETSEETISRVLSSYTIGHKIRHLRLKKKIGLVDLGKHTGLSASLLSQLENGKLVPTLPTLARIAMVFDVGLDYFFGDRNRKRLFMVTRREERMRFPDRPETEQPNYYFECLAFSSNNKSMQAYLAHFPARVTEDVQEHNHDGAEFVHVLTGTLFVRFGEEEYELREGDSAYFDATEPHGYRGCDTPETTAIVVTTPPRL